MQVKYAICSIRNTIAASGAMGSRVAADVTYNSFINTKGKSPKVTRDEMPTCRRGQHEQAL